MNILIIGAGQIGGFIAAQFALHTQYNIHLLARSNYDELQKNGITITDAEKNIEFHTNRFTLHNSISQLPLCEILILTLKTSQNPAALSHLKSVCSPGARIITLQNGLDFEDDIVNNLGLPTYSGTCWIKASALGPTHIRHDFGVNIKLGRYETGKNAISIRPADLYIKNLFEQAQLQVDLIDNIKSVQLTKLALNIPLYLLAVLEKISFSEILADARLDERRKLIQAEIVDTAAKLGSPVDVDFIENIIGNLRKMPLQTPASPDEFSENLQRELPVNIDPLLKLAHTHQIELPVLTQIYGKGM